MTKRMLIDDTQPEETRVVIIDGNKVEDVEFESSFRKQIKGNIYTAKVIRVEPSLQAAFVDYGGNRHGFLAFGEIHPDYYNASPELLEAVDREVDEIIERKKQYIKEREEQRERIRAEKQAAYEARKREEEARTAEEARLAEGVAAVATAEPESAAAVATEVTEQIAEPAAEPVAKPKRKYTRRKPLKKKSEAEIPAEDSTEKTEEPKEELKVLSADSDNNDAVVCDDCSDDENDSFDSESEYDAADNDDDDSDEDFELQRKLLRARKLYHYSTIQDVIKEGQTLLIQVVKEERGNKGAACTTYLSLAGKYCVLMPNRIKSGGVSRKITNAADRKRLKEIMKELPLTANMSMIIRTPAKIKPKQILFAITIT